MDNFEILIVDDLKDNLIALEKLLYKEKRIFHKATTGAEALKLVLKYPDIGLILLDVQMPGMDGFEVAKLLNINPQTRNIPFIFVTSNYIGDKDILEGFETGAVDYLIKPLNPTITKSKVSVFEKLYYKQVELKKIIAERDIVNAQLERYTKVMAHDLKTPLAGIASLISLIRMNE
ncbi:MAG: response regulator, partial [Pyrinomonadaceae bacterium]|nr:response regulator [Sphingobacteriaceae bacterium]